MMIKKINHLTAPCERFPSGWSGPTWSNSGKKPVRQKSC